MKKLITCIIAFVLIAVFIVKCTGEQRPTDKATAKIIKRANNKADKDKLIKRILDVKDIDSYHVFELWGMKAVDEKYGIECLRKSGERYYSIHKTNEGGYWYIEYEYNPEYKVWDIKGNVYLMKSLRKPDFDSIIEQKSTFEDVKKIDPLAELETSGTQRLSVHLLVETDSYSFLYENIEGKEVVTEINYIPPQHDGIFKWIHKEDLPK